MSERCPCGVGVSANGFDACGLNLEDIAGGRSRGIGRQIEELRERIKALSPTVSGPVASCEDAVRGKSPARFQRIQDCLLPRGCSILDPPARDSCLRQHSPSPLRLTSTGSELEDDSPESLLVRQLQRENALLVTQNASLQKELTRLTAGLHGLTTRFDNELQLERIRHPSCLESPREQLTDLMKEQLASYQSDFDEERQRCARMRERNIFLEEQLEEAKRTIETQEKKLIMYAQLVASPVPTELTLRPRPTPKSRSVPTTPLYHNTQSFAFRQAHPQCTTPPSRQYEMQRISENCERDKAGVNFRLSRACETPRRSEFADYVPDGRNAHFWYEDDEVNAKSIRLPSRVRSRSLPH